MVRRVALLTAATAAGLLGVAAASAQTQGEMNQGALARYRAADRALNQTYGKLAAEASPGGRVRLRTAQRAWIRFRDADCEARAGSRGGSFHAAAMASCKEAATAARTRVLAAELACEEGDLSCGGHRQD